MEQIVSAAILETYFTKLRDHLSLDVAIVGGGPSGLVAATTLAGLGRKVGLFEKKLAPGGGMWGGAMLFNQIVVQKEALPILDAFGISYRAWDEQHATADSVEATAALIYRARKAGAIIFNGTSVEDVVFHNDRVCGVVVNWTPVQLNNMHVDPMVFMADCVLDGTGHPCEVAAIVARKNGVKLDTPTGGVLYERSLSVEEGESATIDNTKQVFPGLFVSGMSANGVSGSFRMGPIFGGMLMSGKKVAGLIDEELTRIGKIR